MLMLTILGFYRRADTRSFEDKINNHDAAILRSVVVLFCPDVSLLLAAFEDAANNPEDGNGDDGDDKYKQPERTNDNDFLDN